MSEQNQEIASQDSLNWKGIQLLVLDVDGVLTDGTVFMGPDGYELKQFCVLDGLGLQCLRKMGITLAVISGRLSPATTSRMSELNFDHIIQGRKDKLEALQELATSLRTYGLIQPITVRRLSEGYCRKTHNWRGKGTTSVRRSNNGGRESQ